MGLGVVGLFGLLAAKRRRSLKTGAAACVAVTAAVLSAQAATIDQTLTNPPAGTDWNQPSVWGDNLVVPTDDYNMIPGQPGSGRVSRRRGLPGLIAGKSVTRPPRASLKGGSSDQ